MAKEIALYFTIAVLLAVAVFAGAFSLIEWTSQENCVCVEGLRWCEYDPGVWTQFGGECRTTDEVKP